MKKYNVTITETLKKTVEIEAKSQEEAEQKIADDWYKGEHILDADKDARVLDFDWVLDIREQCVRKNVNFEFRQCGTHFVKDGKLYNLQTKDLCRQARLAGINYGHEPFRNNS